MDYITDTNRIDEKKLESEEQRYKASIQEQAETQLYLSNIQEQKDLEQAKLEEEQNKNSVGKEIGNAVVGGLADAGSDVLTLPERAVDMFSGEMAKAGDDYKPDCKFQEFMIGKVKPEKNYRNIGELRVTNNAVLYNRSYNAHSNELHDTTATHNEV